MIDLVLSSSWTVDEYGVRPLGKKPKQMGATSPRRQRIRERIARYGTTYADRERDREP